MIVFSHFVKLFHGKKVIYIYPNMEFKILISEGSVIYALRKKYHNVIHDSYIDFLFLGNNVAE